MKINRDSSPPTLAKINLTNAARLVIIFPPQHLVERAFYEAAKVFAEPDPPDPANPAVEEKPAAPPVEARLSGPSRLAFEVPDDVLPLEFSVDTLLDWLPFLPLLTPVGGYARGPHPVISAPSGTETALELPWHLLISPGPLGRWAHSRLPVTRNGRTELWHTRLGVPRVARPDNDFDKDGIDEVKADGREIRAIYALDDGFESDLEKAQKGEKPSFKLPVFRMAMTEKDRFDVVRNTSDFIKAPTFVPVPVEVDRLMLSALGGWLDSDGRWTDDPAKQLNSLLQWRHRSTVGRDHYVRIVRLGYLFPYTFKAVLITVTERKFQAAAPPTPANRMVAYLRQRKFIVVRRPARNLAAAEPHQPVEGRAYPFTRVRSVTLVTPDLDPPKSFLPVDDLEALGAVEPLDEQVFVPRVGNKPFLFHVSGTDRAGRGADFTSPVIFVNSEVAFLAGFPPLLHEAFNDLGLGVGENTTFLTGEMVHLAASSEPGDTEQELHKLVLGSERAEGSHPPKVFKEADVPDFFPTMRLAQIRLAAAERISGGDLGRPHLIYDDDYVKFDLKPGEVYARLASAAGAELPVALTYGADKSGGVVTPNLGVAGLSRKLGVVGNDFGSLENGEISPSAFFGTGSPKLLGGLSLVDILAPKLPLNKAPELKTRRLGSVTETTLRWRPTLKQHGTFNPHDPDGLFIEAVTRTDPEDPTESTTSVTGDIRNFELNLAFLTLHFSRLHFESLPGQKPSVTPQITSAEFTEELQFLEALESFLSSDGFTIDVTPTQVSAQLEIPLPDIPVGVFSLQNLTFVIGVTVPFVDSPTRARFAFCSRENPFILTVMGLGGGGFVGLEVGPDGVELFEATLEAGASVALDFGVASGEIHVMGGFYFQMATDQDGNETATFTGYVRLGGSVEAFAILTVSIELEISLTFVSPNVLIGQATMTIEVDIAFFSASADVTVERKFTGDSNDPTLPEAMSSGDWAAYAAAFAPLGP